MKLLYLCSDFGISASGTKGASQHLRSFMRGVVSCGHEVQFLSPKPGMEDEPGVSRVLPPGCDPVEKAAKPLKRWLIASGFDDALPRDLRTLLYNTWAPDRACEQLRDTPPDAIVERYSLFSHVGIDLADRLDVPLILEVNALLTEEAAAFRTLNLSQLANQIERRAFMRAEAVVTVSKTLAERIIDMGVPAGRVHVVPNGADPSVFELASDKTICRNALRIDNKDFVVGFTGSLKPWHGVDALIDAYAQLHSQRPDTKLLIVGTGPIEAALRQRVNNLGLQDNVIFTGVLPHEEVPNMLRAMDVGVAPYTDVSDFYFSPLKVFEYMAAGLCVVSPRLGQMAHLIENGVNGLLYPPGQSAGLEETLLRAYDDPKLRERTGAAARQTILDGYTWEHVSGMVLDVVQEKISQHGTTVTGGKPVRAGVVA